MADTIPQVAVLWNYISSAYADFQDKPLVEEFWSAMGAGIQRLYDNVGNAQASRTMQFMKPTFDYGPQRYIIAYSGVLPPYITSSGTNIEIPEVTALVPGFEQVANGGFEVNLSGWNTAGGATQSSAQAHTGTYSMAVPPGGWSSYTLPGKSFAPLHFQMWVYIPGDIGTAVIKLYGPNGLIATIMPDPNLRFQWQKISRDFLTSAITSIYVSSPGNNTIYVDNVSLIGSYQFAFPIDEWTYSIPTLQYSYMYNGVVYSGMYTQGVDYVINNSFNAILWIGNSPIPDQRYPGIGILNVVAPSILRINPVLANVWCRAIGLNIKTQFNYMTFGQDKYLHLKMFTWALATHRRAVPSIYTLENAYGIARGLPFAYASGILSWTMISGLYNVTVGVYTYLFPSGIVPRQSGLAYNTFELIGSGLNLWDYTTNAGMITPYTNVFNQNNFLLYKLDSSLSGLSFSQDFLTGYIASIMPKQVTFIST